MEMTQKRLKAIVVVSLLSAFVVGSVGIYMAWQTSIVKVPYIVRVEDNTVGSTGNFTVTVKVTKGTLSTTLSWIMDYNSINYRWTPRMFPYAENAKDELDVFFEITFSDVLDVVRITLRPEEKSSGLGHTVTVGQRTILVT